MRRPCPGADKETFRQMPKPPKDVASAHSAGKPSARAERWLPRAMLSGMLALVLGLLMSMGSYYIYRHEQAFQIRLDDIETKALARLDQSLQEEDSHLTNDLNETRNGVEPDLVLKL